MYRIRNAPKKPSNTPPSQKQGKGDAFDKDAAKRLLLSLFEDLTKEAQIPYTIERHKHQYLMQILVVRAIYSIFFSRLSPKQRKHFASVRAAEKKYKEDLTFHNISVPVFWEIQAGKAVRYETATVTLYLDVGDWIGGQRLCFPKMRVMRSTGNQRMQLVTLCMAIVGTSKHNDLSESWEDIADKIGAMATIPFSYEQMMDDPYLIEYAEFLATSAIPFPLIMREIAITEIIRRCQSRIIDRTLEGRDRSSLVSAMKASNAYNSFNGIKPYLRGVIEAMLDKGRYSRWQ